LGFPWHIILAWAGFMFGIGITGNSHQGIVLVSFVIITIGILYEKKQDFKPDWWQDMIANFSGIILGILSILWVL